MTYNGTQVANFANAITLLASSGSASGQPYALFYSFALGTVYAGMTLTYSRQNGTLSVLTVSAVPELATWAMMLVGFDMVGAVARRSRVATKVTHA